MHGKRVVCLCILLLISTFVTCCTQAPAPAAYRATQKPASPVTRVCPIQGEILAVGQDERAGRQLSLGSGSASRYLSSARDVEAYIYESLLAEREEIDLSAFQVPVDVITMLFTEVMNRYPDLFFVNSGISYSYTSSGYVVMLKPSYRMTGKELETARADCAKRLDQICAGVDEIWSDFEIALYLHDYLCLHYAYDTTYQIYDMYTFLTEGRGVCQAYTLTYIALLARYGIASDVAVSTDMNHIWNVITLGGQAYHVDVTWDDPVPNTEGRALHENFLRSDAGIETTGHYAWSSDAACTSDAYESTFLIGVSAPFAYTAGQWFYADGEMRAVLAADFSTMSTKTVLETEEVWLTPDGGSYYIDAFWGVGTYRANLIYNTPEKILAHNLQSGVTVEVDATLPHGMQIFGLWVDGDVVYYSVCDTPDGKMQVLSCSIAQLADYLAGDADQNGRVDGRDVTAILRYLSGLVTVCHTGAADMDDSGTVDGRDVDLLRRYLVENN